MPIIGTAGHVDHGKTTLIKALTGIDTDRLKEEKKRGITIELGFAHIITPSGAKIGIVDVPGHEKFIKNMLAGAGSVDIALVVIAADEGIMPQTREHLDILRMLKITHGVVALTKTDLVEPDWLEMVAMEIEDEVQFLHNAKILPVSSITGEGMDELRTHLFELLETLPAYEPSQNFRLPIDRVFTMEGFGTVVTGTLIEGTLHEGEEVTIFPSLHTTKVRRLQVFGENATTASPGQRVAVNLPVKLEEVTRGDVLAPTNSMELSQTLDVRLDILPGVQRKIQNTRVHLYHGTRDILCRISTAGEHYARLHLAEPLATKTGDPFVIRFYSPLETIGGGVILDPVPASTRAGLAQRLAVKENGSITEKIATYVKERDFPTREYIKARFFNSSPQFDTVLQTLLDEETLYTAGECLIHKEFITWQGEQMQKMLDAYHKKNPLQKGMPINELRQNFPWHENNFATVLQLAAKLGYVKIATDRVAHKNFNAKANEAQQKAYNTLVQTVLNGGFAPPGVEELEGDNKTLFRQVLQTAVDDGSLVMLTPQIVIHTEFYNQAIEIFQREAAGKEITLAQFRDHLQTSRKYAMALLEHFDRKKISRKIGDARVAL